MPVRIDRQVHLTNHVRRQRKRSVDRWWLARFMCPPFVTSCLPVMRAQSQSSRYGLEEKSVKLELPR